MLITLLLLLAAVAIGALALRDSVNDLRLAGVQRRERSAFYCAEAGLTAARSYFAQNVNQWNAMFNPQLAPPAGYPVRGDLDGDGRADYEVTLRDNVDEFPPNGNNPLRDNDLTAIMVSRCIQTDLLPRTLEQIVVYNGRGTNYRDQLGHGSNHSGNEN